MEDLSKDVSDTLARRTYAESGDYYVRPFGVTYLNSLMIMLVVVEF